MLTGKEVKQIAPSFFWLLRDALLEPTDDNGQSCHFRDYLLEKVGCYSMHLQYFSTK